MNYIFDFLVWTFVLYWLHRLAHVTPILRQIHNYHHRCVTQNRHVGKWHYTNIFLFNDNWPSTIDLWVTEVIPTIILSYIINSWWIFLFYYLWAAFFQESLEHNPHLNVYPFTSGVWHLVHHRYPKYNFGLFFPIWDIIFQTQRKAS